MIPLYFEFWSRLDHIFMFHPCFHIIYSLKVYNPLNPQSSDTCDSLMSSSNNKQGANNQSSFINNQQSIIGLQFFIPRGFAHGFAVLSETAVFQYKCDEFYHPEADGGINIKDETLGIDWHIPVEKAILSEKDLKHACLKDSVLDFDINDKLYK